MPLDTSNAPILSLKAMLHRESALGTTVLPPPTAEEPTAAADQPLLGRKPGQRKTKKVADLFCGAGGSSKGAKRAIEALGFIMELVCVNHWPLAVETHKINHPTARHYCQDVSSLRPLAAVPEGWLDLLMASPTCTFHSRARGGRPTSDQQRMDPWHVVTWLTELRVKRLMIENVPEFVEWGPVDMRTGRPIKNRKGEYFRQWVKTLEALGYKCEWRILTCADYGDATTRTRFFLLARNDGKPLPWPVATYSKTGEPDLFGHGAKKWRSAREIIDWSIPGKSLWGRKKGLAAKTLDRTIAGCRKFGWPVAYLHALLPLLKRQLETELAEASGILTAEMPVDAAKQEKAEKKRKEARNTITYASARLEKLAREMSELDQPRSAAPGEPIIVVLRGTEASHIRSGACGIDEPLPTVTANGYHLAVASPGAEPFVFGNRENNVGKPIDGPLPGMTTTTGGGIVLVDGAAEPLVLGQQSCAAARSVDEPVPTIATGGYLRLIQGDTRPILVTVTGADKPKAPRDIEDPLGTITTHNGVGLVQPVLLQLKGQSGPASIDAPVPTITTMRHMAVAEPVLVQMKGRSDAADIDAPAPTITTVQQLAVAEPLIAPYYGNGSGQTCSGVDDPLPTATAKARFALLEPGVESFVVSPRHSREGAGPAPRSTNDPLPTITAGGSQMGVVEPTAEPYLVVVSHGVGNEKDQATRRSMSVDNPLPTVTAGGRQMAVVEPAAEAFILRSDMHQSNAGCVYSTEEPLRTITTSNGLGVVESSTSPFVVPQFGEREGQIPRTHDVDDPLPTVTSHGAGALVAPEYHQISPEDYAHLQRFSDEGRLVMIDGKLHVLDVRFRMLLNPELARATGFDDDESRYEFVGNQSEITKQIGNAVPVNTAAALVSAIMSV